MKKLRFSLIKNKKNYNNMNLLLLNFKCNIINNYNTHSRLNKILIMIQFPRKYKFKTIKFQSLLNHINLILIKTLIINSKNP